MTANPHLYATRREYVEAFKAGTPTTQWPEWAATALKNGFLQDPSGTGPLRIGSDWGYLEVQSHHWVVRMPDGELVRLPEEVFMARYAPVSNPQEATCPPS